MRPKQVLALRPHHALCLLLFCPDGHSVRYAEKMRQLIRRIEQEEGSHIRMIPTPDEICGYCPYYDQGLCQKEDEVFCSDVNVLARCGLRFGDVVPWAELRRGLIAHIVEAGVIDEVCRGCMYLVRCRGRAPAHPGP
ncbi:MAG: DUF1284 domain-containing protein [Oscillospiraceae bacterium]|nr:DUF1284 domain-containing protein [Oscillospiraceae bacterium]